MIFNKETKHLFYYGTTYRDSIKGVIISCDSLDIKSYERIKSTTINYPNKYTERSSCQVILNTAIIAYQ